MIALPAVDRQWGAERLEDFVSAIDDLEKLYAAQNRAGSWQPSGVAHQEHLDKDVLIGPPS
ncbi:MAG: hypothetical protein ACRDS9_26430 [Pseudonocardiaceae bacterium]